VRAFCNIERGHTVGAEPNIIAFPGAKLVLTKNELEGHLSQLREKLLPFYEDDEDKLDQDIDQAKAADIGAVGLMSAIAWCHGQLGLYSDVLNISESREEQARAD